MSTIYYLWNEDGTQAGSVEVADPNGPLPERCTPTPPPSPTAQWIAGGWCEPEAPTLEALQAQLKSQASALRWVHETGGITVGGVRVSTGIEDQNRIATVLAAAQVAELTSINFKAESGWVALSLAELQGIAAAITAHVQACFTAERAHHEAIDALESVAQALAYDLTAGWPAA